LLHDADVTERALRAEPSMSPILLLHICAGTVGLVSGIVSVSVRKGERVHRAAGTIFFVSMLMMSAMATYLAVPLKQWGNVIGGIVTFYLVSTAWMTVRRREGTTGRFEIGAMAVAAAGAIAIFIFGLQAAANPKGMPDGAPVAAYFFMAGIAGLAAALDLKVIVQGGVSGLRRLARHLWRMCFALFIASGSFYTQFILRKVHLPHFLHGSPLLFVPIVAPLFLIAFWQFRMRFTGWFGNLAPMAERTVT
jgi:hypothetical protein